MFRLRLITAFALTASLACGLAACSPPPSPNYVAPNTGQEGARYDEVMKARQCEDELSELARREKDHNHRVQVADDAYVTTHNEVIANKNKAMLAAEEAKLNADSDAWKARCSNL